MISGLIHITGPNNVGKTTLAISAAHPKRVICLDFEKSAEGFNVTLPLGKYVNVMGEFLPTNNNQVNAARLYQFVLSKLEAIPANTYDVCVLDNASVLEEGVVQYVEQNCTKFGLTAGQVAKMNMLVYGPARDELRRMVDIIHGKGIPTVIVTTHLTEKRNQDGSATGMYSPKGAKSFAMTSVLTLWLRPRKGSRVPCALVIKDRLGSPYYVTSFSPVTYDDGEKEQVAEDKVARAIVRSARDNGITEGDLPCTISIPRLPRKIPIANWAAINRYLANPADWDNPADGEVPSEDELHILNNTMSAEALDTLRLARLVAEKEAREAAKVTPPQNAGEFMVRAIKELHLDAVTVISRLGQPLTEVSDWAAAWDKVSVEVVDG